MTRDKRRRLELLAKAMALHCMRNTYLEDLHSELAGFSDAKMKRLMVDVTNQLYSFLALMNDDSEEVRQNFSDYILTMQPSQEWQKPVMNPSLRRTVMGWQTTKRVFVSASPLAVKKGRSSR